LQKKGVKFEWNPKCVEIFQQLKDVLTSASILNIADLDEYFVVCMNLCKEGIGGVLTQKDHMVCYESRKLKQNERNYTTHDLELKTIVHTSNIWIDYLMGRIFELRIDHCGMKHFFGQPTLNVRKTRWMKFFSEYDIEIKHLKVRENQVVDALSRRDHEMNISFIRMFKKYLKYIVL
jgi:hypothetical protein